MSSEINLVRGLMARRPPGPAKGVKDKGVNDFVAEVMQRNHYVLIG